MTLLSYVISCLLWKEQTGVYIHSFQPRQPQRSVESQCLSVQRNTKTRTMLKRLVLLLVCEVSLYNLVTSARVCGRPPQVRGARVQDEMQVYEPGQEIIYQCNPGYRMTAGSRKIICKATGTWPSPTMKCSPKLCSYPGSLVNGHVLFSSLEFQTTVNFTCLEGYILHGHNDSECQHDSTWSNPLPVCKPVTCGLPEIPKYGLIKHHTKLTGNTTYFGDTVQYECSSPYVLFGNEFGSCSANGNWTETPECKLVTCPPPTDIENGFMSFAILRNHGYGEKIRYGCKPNYVLDGSMEIQCEKTGHWSTKPVCRASCIISAKRARIFYNGQKIWVEDLPASRVQHADMVAFYCKDKDRACGYPVLTQCVDGNLIIPSCYKEPSGYTYNLYYRNLPSEIKQC